jgi:Secretion system C-terminal sorting domain
MKTNLYKTAILAAAFFTGLHSQAQTTLKMGSTGGPAGSGPGTGAQTVTLYEGGTLAYSPAITVTYSLSNQQYGAGTLEGLASNSAMNFGGTLNSTANSPMNAQPYYGLMNAISTPLSSMFSACNTCGATGIDVTTDRAISFFNSTDAFINASTGVNSKALNARVYVGDLTLTFNRPVSNPILQIVGLGGTTTVTKSGKIYDFGFSTEFDLIGSSVSLSKVVGNTQLTVTTSQITNNATWLGAASQGAVSNGITRYAASGSVMAQGTNVSSISFKVYVRGDGGRVNDGTNVITADAGLNPMWAFGATNPFATTGMVSGDLMLFGVSIKKPANVNGNVFHDVNGGNVNNSTGTTNSVPSGMYANLLDASGKVVASVAVNADGTYNFTAVSEGTYTVTISTTAGVTGASAPATSLPSGWQATGEYNGTANTGNDGTVNSTSAAFTVVATDVTNINFGIQQPPVAPDQSYTIAQPLYGAVMALNGSGSISSPATLRGTDPEDGTLGSSNTFVISTGAAMNGNKLYYNGVEITGTTSIANFNPALLAVMYVGGGYNNLSFTYQSVDAAGQTSSPATYSINWLTPLPVRVFEATAIANGNNVQVSWKTENEINTSRFYTERSLDNKNFTTIATTAAAGNSAYSKNYSIQDDISAVNSTVIYYRIKLVDVDGKTSYSNTIVIKTAGVESVKVWPNPFVAAVNVSLYSPVNGSVMMRLADAGGKVVAQITNKVVKGNNQLSLTNLQTVAPGMYILQVADNSGIIKYSQKIIK